MSSMIIASAKVHTTVTAHRLDKINQGANKIMREQLGTRFESVTTSPKVAKSVQEITVGTVLITPKESERIVSSIGYCGC